MIVRNSVIVPMDESYWYRMITNHQKALCQKVSLNARHVYKVFFLWLQKYCFAFEYAPEKTMLATDVLSGAYFHYDETQNSKTELIHCVQSVMNQIPISKG